MVNLQFEYSRPLNLMLASAIKKDFTITDEKNIIKITKEFNKNQKYKQNNNNNILSLIEKYSNLKFQKDIICFFTKHLYFTAISSPLIINYQKTIKETEEILIHELIHKILTQNKEKITPLLSTAFPSQDIDFKIHILVLLVQKKVMTELYNKNELNDFIKKDAKNLELEWQIANQFIKKYKNNIMQFLQTENLEI